MIDLSILPSRLPAIQTIEGPLTIERIASKHVDPLCEAGQKSVESIRPWLGTSLCPVTLPAARQCVAALELSRKQNYGLAYVLMNGPICFGMGVINYIHPIHLNANLGFWIRPDATGRGLAVALNQRLIKLAFEQMKLVRLEILVEPTNKASIRVAQKLNAEKEGLCQKRVFGRDAFLFRLTA
ncbi:GNAT family N-acetyltransferase [Alteromonas sp. ASW11-130]|uniref:GNAT family N-acetyltransferase n=1 Tax=Alteromonas sp. ASW11-130 TaxID=3015775 RepID=UPI002242B8F5|nr:GNAT family protein [Alteromonas sp. ASW11-130]MCW8092552.1 GNAT family N-acetyltransferase [Alteromonas sp. ASW11-130]